MKNKKNDKKNKIKTITLLKNKGVMGFKTKQYHVIFIITPIAPITPFFKSVLREQNYKYIF